MSPDLNPIENFWGELKSAIGEKNLANIQKLEQILKEEWEKILEVQETYRWLQEMCEGYHRYQTVCN